MTYRVHVCDDEPHIVLAVSLKLSKAGIQVSTANNGEDAWASIQKERPQLLITDLQMPRLDGLDLIRRLRSHEEYRSIPVILLTAMGFELDENELRTDLGVRHVICKPFSPRELLLTAQSLLEEVEIQEHA